MKKLLFLILLLALPAYGQTLGPSSVGMSQPGAIPGVMDNSVAPSGAVGEIITATNTAVAITSATPKTITSVSIPAGDWNVWCSFQIVPSINTAPTAFTGSLSDTDNSSGLVLGNYVRFATTFAIDGSNIALASPPTPLQFLSATTRYCVANFIFTLGTGVTASAKITARRMR